MALIRARIFDGAIAHLTTLATIWTAGTIKARFINDQAFDRDAAVADYTGVLGADITLAGKAVVSDTTNGIFGLDADNILSNVPGGGGSDTDAVIIYRDDTVDVPLFYIAATNANIGAADTATLVGDANGFIQFMHPVPALMASWFAGDIDVEDLPSTLSVFGVAAVPSAKTINSLTPTTDTLTIGYSLVDSNATWNGGTFQRCLKTNSVLTMNVDAGFLHGLVVGDPDANQMYAYIPIRRTFPTARKVKFNVPAEGIFCIGGF